MADDGIEDIDLILMMTAMSRMISSALIAHRLICRQKTQDVNWKNAWK